MHDCPDCGGACDCDMEDHEQDAPEDCSHECEEYDGEEEELPREGWEMTPDERAPMTADQLAAELYRRQGFVVVTSAAPMSIGDVFHSANALTPGRVVGPASLSDWVAQDRLVELLTGELSRDPWPYFYKCEAAD